MSVDPARLALIGYAGEAFGTPVSARRFDALLDQTDLKLGDHALDLGCGHGQAALRLAGRGLRVHAVERHASVAEAAARRTAAASPGSIHVVIAEAREVLSASTRYRLVMAVGAGRLVGREAQPVDTLLALARAAEPGGWVLWGETFWRAPPSPRLRLVADASGAYGRHAEHVAAGVEAGLTPIAAEESTRDEWDRYVFGYVAAFERHARLHPKEPGAPALLDRARAWRDLYLQEAREVMGFGLYLFWKPQA